ncbi:hypothetical protein A3A46_01920 [Candidatus Roizmanbacteria bacterium RIFCSPLOWO2_01_FULL_37_13]|uniref:Glycosyltransferase 2-like domain-containing protein n=1 Tax=Candidatus Roizmanbacteria bacterium RIFCSPHIGHO2_02_FULL_38_11 TaxID=1802039 RepID=A0A1F7GYP8_9BACT|nr:MAG: hypothetical protein A3C25_05780 [Candidatus Roizmanbacteria bacterium RIFCSPHIGHO2_02_FULL_38_11]OGK35121.1 MAG: hypothetical protein A3F58_02660 [Candidatus Roizmanbacteria bacterium RIFCSPHIGHO2_12_FULL_37_9b]OGK42981.1 MAG: hypothetical protein A3A46_01920 [Candidatus Roizmanbacteria bacterium RIFCSPLOWO2_01_FULL_37_13]
MKNQISDLTVIVPAYNEEKSILDTLESIKNQTVKPKKIIVVDDHSTDRTAEVARKAGVTVFETPINTGSKAGAQNYALRQTTTKFVMALDADTTMDRYAVEKLLEAFKDENTAAACGFVIPRFVNTIWERGRYIEYLIAFTYYKPIQEYFGKPLISSGCFSMYRTRFLKESNGWPTRTMAEDMDLTWSFHKKKFNVRFIPEAVCYPIEPQNFTFMKKQLIRWSHGFVQNLMLHWKDVLAVPYLNFIIAVMTWDSIVASIMYLFVIPIFSVIFKSPYLLLLFIIDAPIVFIPVFLRGLKRKELLKVVFSFPSFFILRIVNAIFIMEAYWTEIILKKRLTQYEKGH